MKRNIKKFAAAFVCIVTVLFATAQNADEIFKAAGSPVNPKVPMNWSRYNDHKGITEICKKIAAAYPDLCKLESLGKSFKGRDLWCLTITDFKKGNPDKKPGMYIDGNIH